MNDEARNIDPEADAQPEPSIPDGGLAEAMPDWLRRPPAWRGMPVPDVPPPDPVAAPAPSVEVEAAVPEVPEAAMTAQPPRELPPPDTAPIDPSSLIDLDDLPEWLASLGRRTRPSLPPDAGQTRQMADAEAPPTQAPAEEPDIPLPPSLRSDEPSSTVATRAPAPAADGGALFGMSRPLLGLALVLVVVVVVAILLAVFG